MDAGGGSERHSGKFIKSVVRSTFPCSPEREREREREREPEDVGGGGSGRTCWKSLRIYNPMAVVAIFFGFSLIFYFFDCFARSSSTFPYSPKYFLIGNFLSSTLFYCISPGFIAFSMSYMSHRGL